MDSIDIIEHIKDQYYDFMDGRLSVRDLDETLREFGIYSDEPMDYCLVITTILWAYESSQDEWNCLANAYLLTGNDDIARQVDKAADDNMQSIMDDLLNGHYVKAVRKVVRRQKAKEKFGRVSKADRQLQLQIRVLWLLHAAKGKLVIPAR